MGGGVGWWGDGVVRWGESVEAGGRGNGRGGESIISIFISCASWLFCFGFSMFAVDTISRTLFFWFLRSSWHCQVRIRNRSPVIFQSSVSQRATF